MTKAVVYGRLLQMEQLEVAAARPSGVVLPGALLRPAAAAGSPGSVPCIVMLHGVLSHRDHNFAPALAEALFKTTGHAIYRFDFRFAPEPDKEPDFRYRFSGFADDIDDLRVVIAHLKATGYAPWCLVGHSRGANDVLIAAAELASMFTDSDAAAGSAAVDASVCAGAGAALAPLATSAVSSLSRPPRLAVAALAARFTMPQMFARLFSPEQQAAVDDPVQGCRFVWASKRGDLLVTQDDADVVRCRMDMGVTVRRIHPAVPILHMHGDGDEVIPVADAALFLSARAGSAVAATSGEAAAAAAEACGSRTVDATCGACTPAVAAPAETAAFAETAAPAVSSTDGAAPKCGSTSCSCGVGEVAATSSPANSRLVVVEGARHAFAGKHQQRMLLRTVTEWVVEQANALGVALSPPSDAAAAGGSAAGGKAGGKPAGSKASKSKAAAAACPVDARSPTVAPSERAPEPTKADGAAAAAVSGSPNV